jgi:xylulokinase
LSDVFAQAFANTTQAAVEFYKTDGAEGAARAAALGSGYYASAKEAFAGLRKLNVIEPQKELMETYGEAYGRWAAELPTN